MAPVIGMVQEILYWSFQVIFISRLLTLTTDSLESFKTEMNTVISTIDGRIDAYVEKTDNLEQDDYPNGNFHQWSDGGFKVVLQEV